MPRRSATSRTAWDASAETVDESTRTAGAASGFGEHAAGADRDGLEVVGSGHHREHDVLPAGQIGRSPDDGRAERRQRLGLRRRAVPHGDVAAPRQQPLGAAGAPILPAPIQPTAPLAVLPSLTSSISPPRTLPAGTAIDCRIL